MNRPIKQWDSHAKQLDDFAQEPDGPGVVWPNAKTLPEQHISSSAGIIRGPEERSAGGAPVTTAHSFVREFLCGMCLSKPRIMPAFGVVFLNLADSFKELAYFGSTVNGCAEDSDGLEVKELPSEELMHC